MRESVFRSYDIRGIVGHDLLLEEIYALVQAIGYFFKTRSVLSVAVGMDGRLHSSAIRELLIKALNDSGFDVINVGLCPSPALYFALNTLPVDAGIMITASHNPREYNGLKICCGLTPIWGNELSVIKKYFLERLHVRLARSAQCYDEPIIEHYLRYLCDHFKHLKGASLRATLDCGSGAASVVIPLLVERMKWREVECLHAQVDGAFPHRSADPTSPGAADALVRRVRSRPNNIGIAFDGDADRLVAVSSAGRLVAGDALLAIFARAMVAQQSDLAMVCDIKCSVDLFPQTNRVALHVVPSGHPYVKEKMRTAGCLLGGELSGHYMFADAYFGYDDGIYAMLRLFEIMVKQGKSLEELLAVLPQLVASPEVRLMCTEEQKGAVIEAIGARFCNDLSATIDDMDGVKVTLRSGAWGLVRASHTEPVLSLRFAALDTQALVQVIDQFSAILRAHLDVSPLDELVRGAFSCEG